MKGIFVSPEPSTMPGTQQESEKCFGVYAYNAKLLQLCLTVWDHIDCS